jgi:Abnormal spindle-like microcephaly-assoc'd, ASPM-SPD-2-Hydin
VRLRGVIVVGLLAVAALGIPSAAANSVGPWQADNQPFGNQPVGSPTTETFTINNTDTDPHDIDANGVQISGPDQGDFSVTQDNCGGQTVAPGDNCTIDIRFDPSSLGGENAEVDLSYDGGTPASDLIDLTGTGTGGPTADTQPNTLAFGGQAVGSTSSANTETITNNGNTTLHISSVNVTSGSGVFAISADNCTGTVPAGQQCTVNVRYSPTGLGADSGTLTFTDDAADSPQQVGLTGTGTGAPTADTSPSTLAFGAQTLGSTSAPLTETVTNNGNVALHVSSVAVTAGGTVFAIGNDGCTGTVAAGQQCTVTVRYTPDGPGSDSGTLTLTDDAGDSPQHVSLTGSGQGPVVNVTPGSIGFGSLNTANTATRTVTVQNTGNAALTGLSISVSGGNGSFTVQSTTCGSSLAAGNQCTATVAFSPQSVGGIAGTLVVADNAADSPQDVSLTGTGTSPNMAIAPTTVAFGSLTIGKLGATQPVTVSNTGSGPLTVSTVKVAGANPGSFAITADACAAATVAAGHSCTITLQYTPKLTGTLAGTLTVNSSVAPATVTLGGSGVAPQAVQSIRAAVGCSTSLLTWQPNDSVTGFLNTVIVRRRLRAPRTPSDGRRLAPTGAGRLHDSGLLHHSTYHYALFARYRFHAGGPVVYSKASKNALTTQRICKPMLNQLISSHTPRVSWIAFNGALGYNLQVWLAGKKIYSPQMVPAHFTIPAGHALKANKTYTLKLYAYTKGRTRGHLLIGTSTFDT